MATKQEIIDQLTAAGIEHDPTALKADLEALLPNDGDVSPETTEATVLDPHGHPHRTYSKDLHGDNFRELAEQFVSHPDRAGWTVK